MYDISYFKEKEKKSILQFIEDYPFALITGNDKAGKQVATQIPILLEERNGDLFLLAHIMKKTDHYEAFCNNPNALVIFTGPNAYVSATWYSNPQIGSTWNYMSVQVSGIINFMTDEELVAFMRKLTLKFEGGDKESPTFYDNLPKKFIDNMMPEIAGIEMKVESMNNVFKLSQNRDLKSYENIISQLENKGGSSKMVAIEMKKRKKNLFPSIDPSKDL